MPLRPFRKLGLISFDFVFFTQFLPLEGIWGLSVDAAPSLIGLAQCDTGFKLPTRTKSKLPHR